MGLVAIVLFALIVISLISLFFESGVIEAHTEEKEIEQKPLEPISNKIFTDDKYNHMRYIKESILALNTVVDADHQFHVNLDVWNNCTHDPDFFRMVRSFCFLTKIYLLTIK